MVSEETLAWLIDKAIAWELMAHDLYASLSDAFRSQPGISGFWQQMSDDESGHADACRSARRALSAGRLSETIDRTEREHARLVDATWAEVRERHIETLDDAYEAAHELESSEINTVFRLLTLSLFGDSARRDMLAAQLDEHVGKLDEFGRLHDKAYRSGVQVDDAGRDAL